MVGQGDEPVTGWDPYKAVAWLAALIFCLAFWATIALLVTGNVA